MSGDPLPQQICPDCVEGLHVLDKFYKTSVEAERKLREICWGVRELPEIDNPMVVFDAFLTPAFKRFVSEPLNERFIINIIEPAGTVILSCKTCKRTFVKESAAADHVCESNPPQVQRKPKKAKKHRKRAREKVNFVCEFCQKTFVYEKELTLHKATHDRTSTPGSSFEKRSSCTESSECSENESYSCSFCGMCFTRKTKKISHEMTHLENCF